MKILGIETSCDETALSLIEMSGNKKTPTYKLLAKALISQIDIHKEYGGVFPALAKREHSKNLIPLFHKILKNSKMLIKRPSSAKATEGKEDISKTLEREPELLKAFLDLIPKIERPNIDAIAVTYGPGLEPALWVGINFAKALSETWDIPVISVNHMEGHIMSALIQKTNGPAKKLKSLGGPALSLLISGGHTELVLINKDWKYETIGKTRDDAVGESFDKVARMLDFPYPGGPEISALAEKARKKKLPHTITLPRPMISSKDYDFSFSGLKTAVLYTLKKIPKITHTIKEEISREFEDATTEVLIAKTSRAIKEYKIKTLIVAGGVVANTHIRKSFEKLAKENLKLKLYIPEQFLSTDNAIMIAVAGFFHAKEIKGTNKKAAGTPSGVPAAFGSLKLD